MKSNHVITTHELAQISGKQHWEVLRSTRTALRNLKLAQEDFLIGTAEDGEMFPYYAVPKHIAMRVAEKFNKEQKQDIETHFAVNALESILDKVPNKKTQNAIKQLESGKGHRVGTVQALMNNLEDKPLTTHEKITVATMTSLEMVGYLNEMRKPQDPQIKHNDFMKKVPKVLGTGSLGNFSHTYVHPQNKQIYPCYKFPKREACLMAMSYSYELQAKVFDRMTQLENELSGAFNHPQTKKDWIKLSLEQEEKIEMLSLQMKEAQPAIDFHHAVTEAVNVHDFEETAKVLNVGRNTLTQILRDEKIITKKNLPYQRYIDKGYFTVVEAPTKNDEGKFLLNAKTMVTGKGLQFIQKKI